MSDQPNEREKIAIAVAEKVFGMHVERIQPEWYRRDVWLFFNPGNPLVVYSWDANACNAIMFRNGRDSSDGNADPLPHYLDEIDAAMEIVTHTRSKWWWTITTLENDLYGVEVNDRVNREWTASSASESLPEAIASAAVRAAELSEGSAIRDAEHTEDDNG